MSSSYFVTAECVRVKHPQRELPKNPKVALVAEGGGQRGIFTSGVLDYFLEKDFNPFDLLVGTSAGAQNLTSFLLQKQGFARKAITQLTTQDRFFSPRQMLAGEGGLDLDWYFDHIGEGEYQLPLYDLSNKLAQQEFVIIASDRDKMETVRLNPDSATLVHYLKASSAIPYFYQPKEDWQEQTLVDGGLTAPIPVQQALELGANIIIVIRTAPNDDMQEDSVWDWRKKMTETLWETLESKFRGKSDEYNELLDMVHCHDKIYNETLALISAPPEGVVIIELAPVDRLNSRLLGSSAESMDEDYALGRATAEQFLDNFHHWLGEKSKIQSATQALLNQK